ncbi:hypothetical protein [Spirosoma flavum]|uniref:Uncharacterized protein n=1 Tax=Spirosoma flavum TaxID=2048557 RepID=A0ABW6ASS7_9BACT
MSRLLFILLLSGFTLTGFGQDKTAGPGNVAPDSSLAVQEAHWVAWQKDLYEMGVSVQHDSLRINPIVKQLFTDSLLRQVAYPATYTWPAAVGLLQRMELKQAFWYMINLYPTDSTSRNLVMQSMLAYDRMIDINKAILSSFYTYALADPRIGRLVNGKPDIRHPDLLDKQLHVVREITEYVTGYRKTQPPTRFNLVNPGPAQINLPSAVRNRR